MGQLRTAPAPNVAAAYRFIVGGCNRRGPSDTAPVPPLALAQNPAFILMQDDIHYDDNIDGDRTYFVNRVTKDPAEVKRNTRYFTRALRKWPELQTLWASVPVFCQFGDHDFISNDLHYDSPLPNGNYRDIGIEVRKALYETTPMPALLDPQGRVSAFQWTWGKTRHISMDVQSQRRHLVGLPTRLGHNSGHELVDQYTLITNAITQAGVDGMLLVFLHSPCTVIPAHDGWLVSNNYLTEWTALCNVMKATQAAYGTRFVVTAGDAHVNGADDGGNIDKSTGGMAIKPVYFCCSPWQSTSLNVGSQYYRWNAVASMHAGSDTQLAVLDVSADNRNVSVSFYNCATGAAVLQATYNTAALAAWA